MYLVFTTNRGHKIKIIVKIRNNWRERCDEAHKNGPKLAESKVASLASS